MSLQRKPKPERIRIRVRVDEPVDVTIRIHEPVVLAEWLGVPRWQSLEQPLRQSLEQPQLEPVRVPVRRERIAVPVCVRVELALRLAGSADAHDQPLRIQEERRRGRHGRLLGPHLLRRLVLRPGRVREAPTAHRRI